MMMKDDEEEHALDEMGNIEVSGEGMDRMTKMLKLTEQNLMRRIGAVEDDLAKLDGLEEKIDIGGGGSGGDKPSKAVNLGFTPEDVEKWNKNCERSNELDEKIRQVQINLEILDGSKIKTDISTLTKNQNNFMTKESVEGML